MTSRRMGIIWSFPRLSAVNQRYHWYNYQWSHSFYITQCAYICVYSAYLVYLYITIRLHCTRFIVVVFFSTTRNTCVPISKFFPTKPNFDPRISWTPSQVPTIHLMNSMHAARTSFCRTRSQIVADLGLNEL